MQLAARASERDFPTLRSALDGNVVVKAEGKLCESVWVILRKVRAVYSRYIAQWRGGLLAEVILMVRLE